MPRSLAGRRVGSGPRRHAQLVPTASVIVASSLSLLPIVTQTGWFPDFGLLMLITWRLLRSDVWPAWWGAVLGLANDVITGSPIGLSVALWAAVLLLLDLLEQRTMWRDYWIEWAITALVVLTSEAAQWKIDALTGAPLPFLTVVPQIIVGILFFPFAARICSALDRWRLGH